jgi:Fe2+ or Zn2+ uptake regulation protein
MDIERARREEMRWLILQALYAAQPVGTSELIIKNAIEQVILDATMLEVRRELDYLEERGLVSVTNRNTTTWFAKLNNHGVDIVEYTIDCLPGIARPKKYW